MKNENRKWKQKKTERKFVSRLGCSKRKVTNKVEKEKHQKNFVRFYKIGTYAFTMRVLVDCVCVEMF